MSEPRAYEQLLKDNAVLQTQMTNVLTTLEIVRGDLRAFINCQQDINTEREKRLTKVEERQTEHEKRLADARERERRLVAVESRLNGHDLDKYKTVITILCWAGGVVSAIVVAIAIAALKFWFGI